MSAPGFRGQSRDQRSHTRLVLGPKEMLPEVRTTLGRRTEKHLRNIKESEVAGPSFSEGGRAGVLTAAGGRGLTAPVTDARSLEMALSEATAGQGGTQVCLFSTRRVPKRPDSRSREGQAPVPPLLGGPPTGPLDPDGGTVFPVTGSLVQALPGHSLQPTGSGKAPAPCRRHWCAVQPNSQVLKHLGGFRKEGGSNY